MSDKSIKPLPTYDNSLVPSLNYTGTKTSVNIYNVYEKNMWDWEYDNYATLENSLFGAVKLVKNAVLINIDILDMVLDLIGVELFQ